jgi:hypothetical protein
MCFIFSSPKHSEFLPLFVFQLVHVKAYNMAIKPLQTNINLHCM